MRTENDSGEMSNPSKRQRGDGWEEVSGEGGVQDDARDAPAESAKVRNIVIIYIKIFFVVNKSNLKCMPI